MLQELSRATHTRRSTPTFVPSFLSRYIIYCHLLSLVLPPPNVVHTSATHITQSCPMEGILHTLQGVEHICTAVSLNRDDRPNDISNAMVSATNLRAPSS